MDFLKLAKERYSCRKLTDTAIEPEKIERILQAAIAAPTAKNNQPYKIWKINSPESMAKVKKATNFTFGAGLVFVVGVKKSEAFVRPFDDLNYAEIDGAIVATHLMLAVKAEGLDTTWVGMFDAFKLQSEFEEMKNYELIALFPVGYAAADAKPSPRHEDRRALEKVVIEV